LPSAGPTTLFKAVFSGRTDGGRSKNITVKPIYFYFNYLRLDLFLVIRVPAQIRPQIFLDIHVPRLGFKSQFYLNYLRLIFAGVSKPKKRFAGVCFSPLPQKHMPAKNIRQQVFAGGMPENINTVYVST